MENIEYDINIYGDLMIIDKENETIKTITVPSIKRLFNEKQQLISWLENKIKECNKSIGTDLLKTNATHSNKIVEVSAYQEVLDFVNKGGKE